MDLSKKQIDAMVANGAEIRDHGVKEACPEPLETRMSWTEKEFSAAFEKMALDRGWLTYHTYLSWRSKAGFPDWTLVRNGEVLFVELKKQKGVLSKEQKVWVKDLRAAKANCFVWRPSDWEEITETLR